MSAKQNKKLKTMEEEFTEYLHYVKAAFWICTVGGGIVLTIIGWFVVDKFTSIEKNTDNLGTISTKIAKLETDLVSISSSATRIENNLTSVSSRLGKVEVELGSLGDVADRMSNSEKVVAAAAEKVNELQLQLSERFQSLKLAISELDKSTNTNSSTVQTEMAAALEKIKEHETKLNSLDVTVAKKVTESLQELAKQGASQTIQGRFSLTEKNITKEDNPRIFSIENAVDFGLVDSSSKLSVQSIDLVSVSKKEEVIDYLIKASINKQRTLTVELWHKSDQAILAYPIFAQVVFRID